MTNTFIRSSNLPVSCEESFAWHERPGAFERMTPPWEKVEILEKKGTIHDGDSLSLLVKSEVFPFNLDVCHSNFIKNKQFVDKQVAGPFSFWQHTHSFEPIDDNKSKIIDKVQYKLPFYFFPSLFGAKIVASKLNKLFTYRHRTLIQDLYLHSKYSKNKLKILITGASGLVGKELVPFLTSGGHEVICLSRKVNNLPNNVYWDSDLKNFVNANLIENIDAVIHLAGENIAAKKWSQNRKNKLIESRVTFTADLCNALMKLKNPPKTFISASGIGIFGSRLQDDILTEDSKLGEGFLAQLAQNWENASLVMENCGTRVVHLRFGAIITSAGGLLKKLLTPYKLCVGGPIGTGQQMLPWISLMDALGIILFSLSTQAITGPVNAVSPIILSNNQFSEILAQALDKPNAIRIPEMVVELLFGEMGREILLSGQSAKPIKLQQFGYEYMHSHLHDALSYYLGE